MKRNILNKLIILSTLLFGLVGCKDKPNPSSEPLTEDPTSDTSQPHSSEETPSEPSSEEEPGEDNLLSRPEVANLVYKLNESEQYRLLKKMVTKLDTVTEVESEFHRLTFSDFFIINEHKKKSSTLYQDRAYSSNSEIRTTLRRYNETIEYPHEIYNHKMERFWSDDIYFVVSEYDLLDGQGVDHRFNFEQVSYEELPFIQEPILETEIQLIELYDTFLDEEGKYHFFGEKISYNTHPSGGEYYHEWERNYLDVRVNSNFEVERIYANYIRRFGIFDDEVRRPYEQLEIIDNIVSGSRFISGEVVAMPGLQEKVEEFPKVSFYNTAKVTLEEYNATIDYENNIVTIDEIPTSTVNIDPHRRYKKDGSLFGDFFMAGFTLSKNKAIKLTFNYEAIKVNLHSPLESIEYSENVDIQTTLPEELAQYLVLYQHESGDWYLIYSPKDQVSTPNNHNLDIGFNYEITGYLTEEEEPAGTLSVTDVSISKCMFT